jgi:tetratricopeptide (TPR) repeat protein
MYIAEVAPASIRGRMVSLNQMMIVIGILAAQIVNWLDVARLHWNRSAELDPTFPTVWRNLALEEFNKENNPEQAVADMEKAFSLNTKDGRILMELDQLYKRQGYDHDMRLKHLEQYPELIAQRDDLLLEEITLLNLTGHYEEAKEKLDVHQFHPWEGGEGKVSGQYQLARVELAKQALDRKDYDTAILLLNECLVYHLGEGKLYGAQKNDFYYFLGCAYEAKGENEKAKECWEKATLGPTEPAAAMY